MELISHGMYYCNAKHADITEIIVIVYLNFCYLIIKIFLYYTCWNFYVAKIHIHIHYIYIIYIFKSEMQLKINAIFELLLIKFTDQFTSESIFDSKLKLFLLKLNFNWYVNEFKRRSVIYKFSFSLLLTFLELTTVNNWIIVRYIVR